jgi:hypothetical protein
MKSLSLVIVMAILTVAAAVGCTGRNNHGVTVVKTFAVTAIAAGSCRDATSTALAASPTPIPTPKHRPALVEVSCGSR